MSVLNSKTNRRALLKASAGLGAIATVPMFSAEAAHQADDLASRDQRAYMERVLHRNLGRTLSVSRKQVRLFAKRFTETYGVVDYKRMYGGIVGEYRLTRLFARSIHQRPARS